MLNDFIVLVNRSCAVKTSQNDFFYFPGNRGKSFYFGENFGFSQLSARNLLDF